MASFDARAALSRNPRPSRRLGREPALVGVDRTLRWRDLVDAIRRVAGSRRKAGLVPGWLRSGDTDTVDHGGQIISPAARETVIVTQPGVIDAAAIGVPSRVEDETKLAVAVGSVVPIELRAWTNDRAGKQQRCSGVVRIDELARNANGKALKRELPAARAAFLARSDAA
ncbi:MAG: hypothetical protein AAGE01_01305 [Pseudomonadota bacterium]